MQPQRERYLSSISGELRAQATRVRDLIGDRHWLSDGHHKEYLLKNVVSRHVPSSVLVVRGFVVHPRRMDMVSNEQDLLFLDTSTMAPIFNQGDLCVAFPSQVLAAISVKTKFSQQDLKKAVEGLSSLQQVVAFSSVERPPWCGVFFFEADDTPAARLSEKVGRVLVESGRVGESDSKATGPDVVGISDSAGFIFDPAEPTGGRQVRGFAGDGTIVLLHGLLSHIARSRDSNASDLEQFLSGYDMQPLPGSPFCCGIKGTSGQQ